MPNLDEDLLKKLREDRQEIDFRIKMHWRDSIIGLIVGVVVGVLLGYLIWG